MFLQAVIVEQRLKRNAPGAMTLTERLIPIGSDSAWCVFSRRADSIAWLQNLAKPLRTGSWEVGMTLTVMVRHVQRKRGWGWFVSSTMTLIENDILINADTGTPGDGVDEKFSYVNRMACHINLHTHIHYTYVRIYILYMIICIYIHTLWLSYNNL